MTRDERAGRRRCPTARDLRARRPHVAEPAVNDAAVRRRVRRQDVSPRTRRDWKTNDDGMERLARGGSADRRRRRQLGYVRYLDDFPVHAARRTSGPTRSAAASRRRSSTSCRRRRRSIERCILMTTDPGDLVLDPTCGSGTTAYVAEQWGRRWITIDTSRVPLALARQRLLTATFPYYELQDPERGPGGGFVYKRKPEHEGRGGRRDRPARHAQVDRERRAAGRGGARRPAGGRHEDHAGQRARSSSRRRSRRRSTSTATASEDSGVPEDASYVDRMLEALRRNPSLQLGGNQTIALKNVRPPAQSLTLSAEAQLEPDDAPVAIVFGPENGAVSEKLVFEAAREAHLKQLRAAARHRLRDRAERAGAGRQDRAAGRHPGDLRRRRRPTS